NGAERAAELGLSELTIRKHRSSIMRKLGLHSTAGLLAVAGDAAKPDDQPAPPLAWHNLSPREAEIIRHVVTGLTSKEIARLLGISPLTVQKHRERARQTLGVHTLSEMVRRGRVPSAAVASDRQ
ncbi:MAG: LuxR C-terminal-related transcriptional regulator, partial [Aliidongia sp.]